MSNTKISNRIEEISNRIKKINNKKHITFQEAVKIENEFIIEIVNIKKLAIHIRTSIGEKSDLFKQNKMNLEKYKKTIRDISGIILEKVNTEHDTTFTVKSEMQFHENFYYENGILETLKRKGSYNIVFQKLLTEIIPSHPKDEYPETRKMKRKFYIHCGPTNAGKTHDSIEALKKAKNGMYLAPLRLLALEVYEKLNIDGVYCNLLTGEEEYWIPSAKHTACTVEKANFTEEYDVVVIDESQLMADTQRGFAWVRAILGVKAKNIHVICSPNAVVLLSKIIADCDEEAFIVTHERTTPLIVEKDNFKFPTDVEKGDALIVFSRRMVLQAAAILASNDTKASLIYGNLPPETRRKQVDLFSNGVTDVVVSTDAIGMGLNLPIRRIVFLATEKFDGKNDRPLTTQEVKQIAGRAGRKGMYDVGYVNAIENKKDIEEKLKSEDLELKKAYISPMESTILSLPFGNLKERLLSWTKYNLKVPYIDKIDISVLIELLDHAEVFEDKLSIETLYKAINIPFNHKDKYLLELWLSYLEELTFNVKEIHKPSKNKNDLDSLESYYRSISLYYSFSKIFKLVYDNEWIKRERETVSEDIHILLQDNIKNFNRKCRRCQKILHWEHLFPICDNCYDKHYN